MFKGKDSKLADEVLDRNRIAVIATSTKDYGVSSSAIFFIPVKSNKFRFITKSHTAKYSNIKSSPQVSMTAEAE